MGVESLKQFIQKLGTDDALAGKFKGVSTDPNAVIALGKEHGYEFSAEDMRDLKKQQGEELSDKELENVAGGFVTATAAIVAAGVVVAGVGVVGGAAALGVSAGAAVTAGEGI